MPFYIYTRYHTLYIYIDHKSWMYVLDMVSIAVKRHHDQGNSYKEQHLIGAGLQFQRFSSSSSRQEAWQCLGRHGTGERAKSSTSWSKVARRKGYLSSRQLGRGSQSPPTKWHISSNKVTPTPIRPHLLIVPLPGPILFKPPHIYNMSYINTYVTY